MDEDLRDDELAEEEEAEEELDDDLELPDENGDLPLDKDEEDPFRFGMHEEEDETF